jgi:Sporulation and spore germination
LRQFATVWAVAVAAAAAALTGCAGGAPEAGPTVYLPQRLGPEGPPGQIQPVLMPVKRDRRAGIPAHRQAVLELRVGPTPDERAHAFSRALSPVIRVATVEVRGRVATVELRGGEPGILGVAAIVYSLTEEPDIDAVRLLVDGHRCCVYDMCGRAIQRVTRAVFRGWTGEPCLLRMRPDAVRCRG